MKIPAAAFQAECLEFLDQVEKTRKAKPVAQLAPLPVAPGSLFGYMKNSTTSTGDSTAPLNEEWSALVGDEDHLYQQAVRKTKKPRK